MIKGGRVWNHSALTAVDINSDGMRKILGFMLADSEKEDSWRDFFRALKARGLSVVDLVVSDNHGGLVNAVAIEFQGGHHGSVTRLISPKTSWMRAPRHLRISSTPDSDSGLKRLI